jgi:TonB family protein
MPTKEQLSEDFLKLSDEELIDRLRSGNLIPIATDVARQELTSRRIDVELALARPLQAGISSQPTADPTRNRATALLVRALRFPLRAALGVEPLWTVIVFGAALLFLLFKATVYGLAELGSVSPKPAYALPLAYAAVVVNGVAMAWFALALWRTVGRLKSFFWKIVVRILATLVVLSAVLGTQGATRVVEQFFSRGTSLAQKIARVDAAKDIKPDLSRRSDDQMSRRQPEQRFVEYMEQWRAKVERVGNANYPAEARGRISGSLRLSVSIKADGTVDQIKIDRSSGSDVLDHAAVRTVELASPFAPLPRDIRRDTDILVITRTWTFGPTDRLETR